MMTRIPNIYICTCCASSYNRKIRETVTLIPAEKNDSCLNTKQVAIRKRPVWQPCDGLVRNPGTRRQPRGRHGQEGCLRVGRHLP
jgi:hypothetical protein